MADWKEHFLQLNIIVQDIRDRNDDPFDQNSLERTNPIESLHFLKPYLATGNSQVLCEKIELFYLLLEIQKNPSASMQKAAIF